MLRAEIYDVIRIARHVKDVKQTKKEGRRFQRRLFYLNLFSLQAA
jgi:hypothetical protein